MAGYPSTSMISGEQELARDLIDQRSGLMSKSITTILGEKIVFTYLKVAHKISVNVIENSGHCFAIDSENLPRDFKKITAVNFYSYFTNVNAKVSKLSDGSSKLYINGRLFGGAYKRALDISIHNKNNLNNDKGDIKTVQDELFKLQQFANVSKSSRIIIINKSRYQLIYSSQGTSSGYFFSDVLYAFDKNRTIDKESGVGGIFHTKSGGMCGSIGYFSVKVEVPCRTHIICCGFKTPYSGSINSCGIEIRLEDGNTDSYGRIKGYGIVPTGYVQDIEGLSKTPHDSRNNRSHYAIECSSALIVECEFTNDSQSVYTFTISNSRMTNEDGFNRYIIPEESKSGDSEDTSDQSRRGSNEEKKKDPQVNNDKSNNVSKENAKFKNAEVSLDDSGSFYQKSPILSSSYIGINSSKIEYPSSVVRKSTDSISLSTLTTIPYEVYKSSNDITSYLRNHPDYIKINSENLEYIIAAILSGVAIAGGIALLIVSGGIATPGIIIGSSLLINAGITGLANSFICRKKGSFSWTEFIASFAISSGIVLISFAAGVIVEGLVGLALYGKGLCQASLKALSAVAWKVVDQVNSKGSYYLIEKSGSKFLRLIELVLDNPVNSRGFPGFLGLKVFDRTASMTYLIPKLMRKSDKPEKSCVRLIKVEENEYFPEIELINSRYELKNELDLIKSWVHSPQLNQDMIKILSNCKAIFLDLGFSEKNIDFAIAGKDEYLIEPLLKFSEILNGKPYGKTMRGLGNYVWRAGKNLLSVEILKSNSIKLIDVHVSQSNEEFVLELV